MERVGNIALRVDPFQDENVWAVCDEGCNVCGHGDEWHRTALEKRSLQGHTSFLKDAKIIYNDGVDKAHTVGKFTVPAVLQLLPTRSTLPVVIDSHETKATGSASYVKHRRECAGDSIMLEDFENGRIEAVVRKELDCS